MSLSELRNELKNLRGTVKPLSKMKKEEEQLFNQIKEKYPTLLDEDIINEIQSYLDK